MSINTVLVTAARLRFCVNVKGHGSGGGPRRQALAYASQEWLVKLTS
jgi:hypothetical protein